MESIDLESFLKKNKIEFNTMSDELENSVNEILKFIVAEAELMSNLPLTPVPKMATLLLNTTIKFLRITKRVLKKDSFKDFVQEFKKRFENAIKEIK